MGTEMTTQCGSAAVARIFWPNEEPRDVCGPHLEKALGIAGVVGFYLHSEPTDVGTCSQQVKD